MSSESKDIYYRSLFYDDHQDHNGTGLIGGGSSAYNNSQEFDPSQMGFTDCLNGGFMDYNSLEKAFGMSPASSEVFSSIEGNQKLIGEGDFGGGGGGSENMVTQNSSISSSSTEAGAEEASSKSKTDGQPKGSDDGGESSKKMPTQPSHPNNSERKRCCGCGSRNVPAVYADSSSDEYVTLSSRMVSINNNFMIMDFYKT
ncbi:hypothetical protein JRO89_XS06G0023700 [Xanthoceras sorbifolium]|uniref:Uncharacterized protein n=1 Tax=Xanthoceras sorbifolium TaxID=99658 RepID=A0ABQ8HW97_9ROSI|nr:hypothetical protein JRO89_XS06G0023700 [Xanthoceras sorbifolium]